MKQKNDWQNLEKKMLDSYLQMYNSGDWQKAVTQGNILISMGMRNDVIVETLGKAYFNQGDFTGAIPLLEQIPETNLVKTAEKYWLLGTADNRLKNFMSACQNFNKARQALSTLEGSRDADRARNERELWAQPGFKADVFAQYAVNEMICGDIEAAVRDYKAASDNAITLRDKCECYSSYLMTMHNRCQYMTDIYAAACKYNDIFQAISPYRHKGVRENKKLRVGYISPDFRRHVMFYFFYGLFLAYSREEFEVYAYYLGRNEDKFSRMVQAHVDKWIPLGGRSYSESAACIYADEIDILVDLGGHSVNSALPVMAYKPAPVQISGLGYMGTTGLKMVDYLITDKVCDPQEEEKKITEIPLYLPTMFCYIGRSDVPVPQGMAAAETGYVTFGVFNRYNKISEDMLLAWQKIQADVVGSHFYFKADAYADSLLARKFYGELEQAGFAMDRVMVETSSDDYMEKYLSVDIALDTYPYTGGGTTCDALYMGVPVITLAGQNRGARFGASILKAAGLEDLVAHDMEEYIKLAVALANDWRVLQSLHMNLRDIMQRSLLMDVENYVQSIECEYHRIWEEYKKAGK